MTERREEYTVEEAKAACLLDKARRQGRKPQGSDDSRDKAELARIIAELAREAGWFVREEFHFAKPRRYQADWAISLINACPPGFTWLIEYEGGEFAWIHDQEAGKHQAQRFASDAEKYNEAAIRNFPVLRFTASMVQSGMAADQIRRVMEES